MFTATKIESTIEPKVFVSLNNGVWYYNYDRGQYTTQTQDTNGKNKDEIRYTYVQVRISGKPTVSKCIEAILKQFTNDEGSNLYERLILDGTTPQIEDICYNIKVDFGMEIPRTDLQIAKTEVLRKIDEYDTSSNVNSFELNGVQVWLPKDTRVGLMNSVNIEKDAGKEYSTVWFGGMCITVRCVEAISILSALEMYALECYNVTAQHKANIDQMESISDVQSYDYTVGYPQKLKFSI